MIFHKHSCTAVIAIFNIAVFLIWFFVFLTKNLFE